MGLVGWLVGRGTVLNTRQRSSLAPLDQLGSTAIGHPFRHCFFDAEEGRSTREEAKAGQPSGNSSLLASRIAAILARVWNDVDRAADRARFSCLEAAKDKAIRKARDTAKEGVCVVCLEVQPEILVLCCGAAFHFSCMSRWLAAAPRPLCPACRALIQPPPGDRPPVPDFRVPSQGGTCVMCPNMRAADCALRACSRCCTAMQRLHRVWCPRHVGGLNGAYTSWRRTAADDSGCFLELLDAVRSSKPLFSCGRGLT